MTSIVVSDKTLLENISFVATILVPIIAAIALWYAKKQISASVNSTRRATAHSCYQEYLKLTIQYPLLAFGDELTIRSNSVELGRYKWFVANMLVSFEEILYICEGEMDWENAILDQLKRHAWHLKKSKSVENNHWSDSFQKIIEKAILTAKVSRFGVRDSIRNSPTMVFRVVACD